VIQPNDTDVTTTHSLDRSTPSSTQISNPTRMYAELTWKGGLVTTLPPTYMSECKRSLSSLNDLSRTITSAEHCRCSSASSNRATILSRRLTAGAFLPSMYSVLVFPGKSRTNPSKVAPMFGAETTTLLAKGKMLNPLRGKTFKRISRASFGCSANIP